jgi:hypothetical protein
LAAQFFNLIKRFKVAVSTKFVGITTLTGSVNWWLKMVMIAKVWVVRWYDPVTGTFTPTGGLNTARQWHTATLLNNGMVPIVGGHHQFGDLDIIEACAELYEPATLIPPNLASITYLDCHRACSVHAIPGNNAAVHRHGHVQRQQQGAAWRRDVDLIGYDASADQQRRGQSCGLALAVVRAVAIAASAGTVTGSATLTRQ